MIINKLLSVAFVLGIGAGGTIGAS